jgi:hypothetical protein
MLVLTHLVYLIHQPMTKNCNLPFSKKLNILGEKRSLIPLTHVLHKVEKSISEIDEYYRRLNQKHDHNPFEKIMNDEKKPAFSKYVSKLDL